MSKEFKEVLAYLVRSNTATIFLTGLAVLVSGSQSGEYDAKYVVFGFALLMVNSLINLIDYWRKEIR